MISDVKNLYEGKPDSRGRSTWVDQYTDDLGEAAENAETARYALLIRSKKSSMAARSSRWTPSSSKTPCSRRPSVESWMATLVSLHR